MTYEELRKEADRMGYSLIRKYKKEKLVPCVCGFNRRNHYFVPREKSLYSDVYILECQKCGRKALGTSENEAIHNWNAIYGKENKDE